MCVCVWVVEHIKYLHIFAHHVRCRIEIGRREKQRWWALNWFVIEKKNGLLIQTKSVWRETSVHSKRNRIKHNKHHKRMANRRKDGEREREGQTAKERGTEKEHHLTIMDNWWNDFEALEEKRWMCQNHAKLLAIFGHLPRGQRNILCVVVVAAFFPSLKVQ